MKKLKHNLEFLLPKDFRQIKKLGISAEQILQQLAAFKKGIRFANLIRPASINDGIKKITKAEKDSYISLYENKRHHLSLEKFVPASGAASRMFEIPRFFLNHPERAAALFNTKTVNSPAEEFIYMKTFIQGLEEQIFAFYPDLTAVMKKKLGQVPIIKNHRDLNTILKLLLTPDGLNYSNHPKALIKFHTYDIQSRTPLEEHLLEARQYLMNDQGITSLHFTVSSEHLKSVRRYLKSILPGLNPRHKGFRISFSIQKPNTNTLAVDKNNQPFRDSKDQLVFRPGGHGALIGNLNDLTADLIFITNIDNVVPDHLKPDVVLYKKVLAGYLLSVQEKIFHYLNQLKRDKLHEDLLDQIILFCQKYLNIHFSNEFAKGNPEKKHTAVFNKLNRPIRVCGMVKNAGEPGGGPFWVADHQGRISLQIIEKAQIDHTSEQQQLQLSSSTHFNPVDIVCSLRNVKGEKFNLFEFIDHDAYFIVEKSMAGKSLRALELPGLWNGAMAKWITLFVEVPASTFNPVKTVNDLLRVQHRQQIRRKNQ